VRQDNGHDGARDRKQERADEAEVPSIQEAAEHHDAEEHADETNEHDRQRIERDIDGHRRDRPTRFLPSLVAAAPGSPRH